MTQGNQIEQIHLFIYLKSVRKPIHAILSSSDQITTFYNMLNTEDVIKFGQIMFAKSEFKYARIEQ